MTAPRIPAMALGALLASAFAVSPARAEDVAPIEDNSFLVEEAYNQEPRVVQHIGTWMRPRGGGAWKAGFTQEWPVMGRQHQLSYTIPLQRLPDAAGGASGIGDVALNYRFMWLGVNGGSVAFAPRISALLPTGDADRGLGARAAGVQLNLPLSVAVSRGIVAHTNGGVTFIRERDGNPAAGGPSAPVPATRGVHLGQSVIWLATRRINLMLELAWERTESAGIPGDADVEESLLLAPGVRWAHDFANGLQVVPGVAVPIGLGVGADERSVFLYLSVEHGF